MFGPISKNVITDLLFNLLMAFVALFFLAFLMVNDPKEKEDAAKNDNNILITMRWNTDNDMDLHLRLPDGRGVWYSNRDEPPAHLDVDVVAWRRYRRPDGFDYIIKDNEEIITIRDILRGEYAVNVHYYSARNVDPTKEVDVEILVQDVKNGRIIYSGAKKITMAQKETHFVRFTVEPYDLNDVHKYRVTKVYTDRPIFFVGKTKSSNVGGRGPGTNYDNPEMYNSEGRDNGYNNGYNQGGDD